MRMRERQRFFEEVFQHDVDVYLSSAHLQIDYKRPPLGSISSMEVNVDMLEQMDLMDISDQEALDVFFSASGEEGSLTFYRLLVEKCTHLHSVQKCTPLALNASFFLLEHQ
uniref:Dysbindin-like n=1 Tax=Sinocyclocheilus anshuiensis TaxID=1608454 RepID=A0A671NV97_9TELE